MQTWNKQTEFLVGIKTTLLYSTPEDQLFSSQMLRHQRHIFIHGKGETLEYSQVNCHKLKMRLTC